MKERNKEAEVKFTFGEYKVYSRKRKKEYSVIIFPGELRLWAFDNYPEDNFMIVDGDKTGFRMLSIAFAILAQDPSKIVYFPVKNAEGFGGYYGGTCHLVLACSELQFRRSDWYELKKQFKPKNKGKYTFRYERQKLMDYQEKLERKMSYPEIERENERVHAEEQKEDTIFIVDSKKAYCYKHAQAVKVLRKYKSGVPGYFYCHKVGWLVTDREIWYSTQELLKELEKKEE